MTKTVLRPASTSNGQLDHIIMLMQEAKVPDLQQQRMREFVLDVPNITKIFLSGGAEKYHRIQEWNLFALPDISVAREKAVNRLLSNKDESIADIAKRVLSGASSHFEGPQRVIINERVANYIGYVNRNTLKYTPMHTKVVDDIATVIIRKANLINVEDLIPKEQLPTVTGYVNGAVEALRRGYVMIGMVESRPIVYCMQKPPVSGLARL